MGSVANFITLDRMRRKKPVIFLEDTMDDQSKTQQATEIQINTGDEILRGKYSNNMMASH